MGRQYASGKKAWGECQRSGRKMLLRNMTQDGYYPRLMVDPAWRDSKHPQERLPSTSDPVTLRRPAPENSDDSKTVTVKFPRYDLATNETVGRVNLTGTLHDPATDVIRAALFDTLIDVSTYSTTDEVVSSGYTAGGETLVFTQAVVEGDTQSSAEEITWSGVSFTAVCVMLYNSSRSDEVIAILPFGNPQTTTGSFVIEWAAPLFTDRD